MVDIARSSDVIKKKKIRRALYGAGFLVIIVLITVGVSKLKPAAPSVDRATVWIDTVQRGPMVRQVQGQGTLVPLEIRWITAETAARVERVRARPGIAVKADSVLLDLVNPDVELQALEADRQLAQAQAELTNLEASLTNQRLAQESVVASLKS